MKMHETWDPDILRKVTCKTMRWDVDCVPHIYNPDIVSKTRENICKAFMSLNCH